MKDKINDRLTRRPQFQHQEFNSRSLTIPGQDLTPHEIVRKYVQGGGYNNLNEKYLDQNISQFDKMDTIEKLDYLKEIKRHRNDVQKQLDVQIKALEKKKAAELQQIQNKEITND